MMQILIHKNSSQFSFYFKPSEILNQKNTQKNIADSLSCKEKSHTPKYLDIHIALIIIADFPCINVYFYFYSFKRCICTYIYMIPILPEWTADQQQFLSKHTLIFHFRLLILYCTVLCSHTTIHL